MHFQVAVGLPVFDGPLLLFEYIPEGIDQLYVEHMAQVAWTAGVSADYVGLVPN